MTADVEFTETDQVGKTVISIGGEIICETPITLKELAAEPIFFEYQMNRMRILYCEFGIGDSDRGFYLKVNRVLYDKMLTGPLPVEVEEFERGEVSHDFQDKDLK